MSLKNFTKFSIIFIFLQCTISSYSQNVYKTPSGKKYHLATCRMVENVSSKLVDADAISKYHLTPCSFCHPPAPGIMKRSIIEIDKGKGTAPASVQCRGKTQKGARCRHKTRIGNGYCFQHTAQG